MKTKVFILGGGVAGLSAAHELAKFDKFDVHVFDARARIDGGRGFGGKAVSKHAPFFKNDERGYASEHGFRLVPHFYRHLTQTLKEIPFDENTRPGLVSRHWGEQLESTVIQKAARLPNPEDNVWGNLVGSTQAAYARSGFINVVERPFPATTIDFVGVVRQMLGRDNIATDTDVAYYAWKLLKFMTSCPERREDEYERVTWGEYLGVGQGIYSEQFEKLTRTVPRILSSMRADTCSARSVGHSTIQLLFDFVGDGGTHMESVFAGPTQEMWLDPWVRYLKAQGVTFWPESLVLGLEFESHRIDAAHVWIQPGKEPPVGSTFVGGYETKREVHVDEMGWTPVDLQEHIFAVHAKKDGVDDPSRTYFIAALPLEVLQRLLEDDPKKSYRKTLEDHRRMVRFDYSLQQLQKIERAVAPMVGIQFYLTKDVPICNGHVFYPDAPWALTSVSQAQFWEKQLPGRLADYLQGPEDLSRAEEPRVKGILSVIISEWEVPAPARPEFGKRDPAWKPAQGSTRAQRLDAGLAARFLTQAEIKREVWAQLKDALNVPGKRPLLDDSYLFAAECVDRTVILEECREKDPGDRHMADTAYAAWLDRVLRDSAELDATVRVREPPEPKDKARLPVEEWDCHVAVFASNAPGSSDFAEPAPKNTPLFMHPKDSYQLRPDVELRIPNLLLASDYVRTYTDLATMEAANEAAKRAVLAILRRELPSTEGFPQLHPLTEGRWFEAAQAVDRMLFNAGQPHVMDMPQLFAMLGGTTAQSVLDVGLGFLGVRRKAPPEMARRPGGAISIGTVHAAVKTLRNAQAWVATIRDALLE
jgi:uncharacterized protein with NAD-binding domain and iron-sulfur cluster